MFNKEFYPTPESVLEMMGIDCHNKTVLEPSAGKGDIVDYCKKWGAKEVLACEINDDLRSIVSRKANVINSDFFKVLPENISHIDCIVMNPPFSNADKHILHAWQIAPEGCEIIALCNNETIEKSDYGYRRSELRELISNYGEGMNLGDVFSTAERKTGTNIGLIKLFKPMVTDGNGFDDFYLLGDDTAEDNAVISYNEMRAVVNTYSAAVRCFEKVEKIAKELHAYTNVTFVGKELGTIDGEKKYETHKLSFGHGLSFSAIHRENGITTKQEFARAYQQKCWEFIFKRVGIEKYVTKGVLVDVNKFIANRKNYPFTVKNISKMLDIIVGTRNDIMKRAIVEAVDNFTKHHDENRFGVEGWKTNAGHLLNKKFITGWIANISYSGGLELRTYQCPNHDYLIDLVKAICFVTATEYDNIPKTYTLKNLTPNTWYDWGFFQFKVFKRGTGHFKFKDENVWATLNREYAKIKGQVLPEIF